MFDRSRSSNETSSQRFADWRKSRHSGAVGNCVEVASLPGGNIAMRNSRRPDGAVVVYTHAEMAAFMAGVKDGEFDDILD